MELPDTENTYKVTFEDDGCMITLSQYTGGNIEDLVGQDVIYIDKAHIPQVIKWLEEFLPTEGKE